jgi:Arsenical resistance operon protein ArsD
LAPLAVTDPILAQRRARDFRYIDEVVRQGLPTFLVPWQTEPTRGDNRHQHQAPKGERKMKIEIYDPAMCCSTGVCGPSVDPELVRIQEALRQIQKQAPTVQVQRSGLTSDPQAFVANSAVADLLKNEGPECLPLVFVDGELISKRNYPGNQQLQEILQRARLELALTEKKKSSSGCGPGCC